MNTTQPCTAIAAKVMQLVVQEWISNQLLTRIPDQTICYYRQHPAWYSPEYLTRLSVVTDSTLPDIHQNTWPDYLLLQTAPCLIFTRILVTRLSVVTDSTLPDINQNTWPDYLLLQTAPCLISSEYLTRLSVITDSTLPDIHQNTWPDYLLLQTAPCPIFTKFLVQIYCNAIFFYYYYF